MQPFEIIDISENPELTTEQMGSKDKFWIEYAGESWLFKIARLNTSEHWAERLAAAIAHDLEIPAAIVELATRSETLGTISKSFISNVDTLVHGNELMAGDIDTYDRSRRFKQSDHRVNLILECVERNVQEGPSGDDPVQAFVGYLTLDALIGNTDRHHENWGMIQSTNRPSRLAETYDHASSLGRELSDQNREQKLQSYGVGHYLAHGKGGIYLPTSDRPVQVVASLDDLGYGDQRRHWADNVRAVGVEQILSNVNRVPDDWISPAGRTFAEAIIRFSFGEIVGAR